MKTQCPHCKAGFNVSEAYSGKNAKCPKCKQVFTVTEYKSPMENKTVPSEIPIEKEGRTQKRKDTSEELISKNIPCPFCGEPILKIAKKCKHCGEYLEGKSREVVTNVKQGAIIGATACLIIGLFIMYLSLMSFIIYSPLFIAAFVLSIVAMSQKRVLGGILILLGTVIIPPLLFLGLFVGRQKSLFEPDLESANLTQPANYTEQDNRGNTQQAQHDSSQIEKQKYSQYITLQNIEVAKTTLNEDGIFGEVKNTGNRTLKEVEITVYCLDQNGNPVYEEKFYPVLVTKYSFGDNSPLKPHYAEKFGYKLDDAPSEWSGQVEVNITNIEFSD